MANSAEAKQAQLLIWHVLPLKKQNTEGAVYSSLGPIFLMLDADAGTIVYVSAFCVSESKS